MTANLLLDEWLIEFNPEDTFEVMYLRKKSLNEVHNLLKKYGLGFARFLPQEYINHFRQNHHNYQRLDGGDIARIISHLVINDAHDGQATVHSERIEPSNYWRESLDYYGNNCNPPFWRNPVVTVPEHRKESWSQSCFLDYSTSDNQRRSRCLVSIEQYSQHPHLEPDIDPWRLGISGEIPENCSGPVEQRHERFKILPRPKILPIEMSYDHMVEKLSQRLDVNCCIEGYFFYLPETTWDPRNIDMERWRSGRHFSTDVVKKGPKTGSRGFLDRFENIWLWGGMHNDHWDVQLPDGNHINVSHLGVIL